MKIASRSLLAWLIFLSLGCKQSAPSASQAATPAQPAAAAAAPAPIAPDVPSGVDAERDKQLAEEVRAIIDAWFNSSPELTSDGKTVVFTSNRDGLPQLYAADLASPRSPA